MHFARIFGWALQCAQHSSGPSGFQEIEFVRCLADLKITSWDLWANLLAGKTSTHSVGQWLGTIKWRLTVIDLKIEAQEIRSAEDNIDIFKSGKM